MDVKASVNPGGEQDGFAETNLDVGGEGVRLRIGLDHFRGLPLGQPIGLDLLLVGSVIYAVDQLVCRKATPDAWTRTLNVNIPVLESARWNAARTILDRCVSFLTGDRWKFSFEKLVDSPAAVNPKKLANQPPDAAAVCLFSGGLDSLVGAIDWLSDNANRSLVLVGHHDKTGRAQADQKRLLAIIRQRRPDYGDRMLPQHVAVWQPEKARDTHYRSRSFLFLSMGFYAATTLEDPVPIIIPENGTIAVNVPLTPSRRGSCNTRTAHPFFIEQYQALTRALGLPNQVVNPCIWQTKGEVVAGCKDRDLLERTYISSVSCAKSTRRQHWVRRDVDHCGHCMPCIYRRSAIHAAGLPAERYGLDICLGDIDLTGRAKHADDFRALFAFLKRGLGGDQIAAILQGSCSFGASDVTQHAAVVERAMTEIRNWLAAEVPNGIRQQAGL